MANDFGQDALAMLTSPAYRAYLGDYAQYGLGPEHRFFESRGLPADLSPPPLTQPTADPFQALLRQAAGEGGPGGAPGPGEVSTGSASIDNPGFGDIASALGNVLGFSGPLGFAGALAGLAANAALGNNPNTASLGVMGPVVDAAKGMFGGHPAANAVSAAGGEVGGIGTGSQFSGGSMSANAATGPAGYGGDEAGTGTGFGMSSDPGEAGPGGPAGDTGTGTGFGMGSDPGEAGPGGGGGDGGGGTFICTELHRTGRMPDSLYVVDQVFGMRLQRNDPYAYAGYALWAPGYVKIMQQTGAKGAAARWLAETLMIPCSRAMRTRRPWRRRSPVGLVVLTVGLFVCRMLGRYAKGARTCRTA